MFSSMAELGTAYALFCTLPVTVAIAERFLITEVDRLWDREHLDGLALLSIECQASKQLDLNDLVVKCTNTKCLKNNFEYYEYIGHYASL